MIRPLFVWLHRWVGLTIAGFLVVSGLTGAVISWDHELDDLLNAHLTHVQSQGTSRPALELAGEVEARDPRARVTYLPLAPEPGEALAFGVDPRVDPSTGRLYALGYNQVFVDPVTGAELGRREWGTAWPITRETFVSFLYVLHYSMHIPEMWGIDRWGVWLLGGVAVLWALDCFAGFYLTLPRRRRAAAGRPPAEGRAPRRWWARWTTAWKIRTGSGRWRINFDVHRAFGLWAWGLLFTLAFTAFSLNLYDEVFYPAMSRVSQVTPSPYDQRTPTPLHEPIEPRVAYSTVLASALAEAERRGWDEPLGDTFYSQNFGIYGVRFFRPGDDHGGGGVGPAALYFDSGDGRYLGDRQPWKGTLADLFVQAQFPIHSGRILGIPGRILVSLMGLVTAGLSVTGVLIWWRKRGSRARSVRGRSHAPERDLGRPVPAVVPRARVAGGAQLASVVQEKGRG